MLSSAKGPHWFAPHVEHFARGDKGRGRAARSNSKANNSILNREITNAYYYKSDSQGDFDKIVLSCIRARTSVKNGNDL